MIPQSYQQQKKVNRHWINITQKISAFGLSMNSVVYVSMISLQSHQHGFLGAQISVYSIKLLLADGGNGCGQ